jgi:flagellar basal body-associated protein FliL
MADDKKNPEQPAEGAAPEAQGGKKKLLIIVGAVVAVLAIGGGGAFFFLGGKKSHETPAADAHGKTEAKAEGGGHGEPAKAEGGGHGEPAKAEGGGHGEPAKAEGGGHGGGGGDAAKAEGAAHDAAAEESVIVDITEGKSMIINLRNPLENHAVKISVSVQIKDGADKKISNSLKKDQNARFRDAIISVVSARSRESLLSPDGKDSLRRELQNRFNQYLSGQSPAIEEVFITDFFIE